MRGAITVPLLAIVVACLSACGSLESQHKAAASLRAVSVQDASVRLYTLDPRLSASPSTVNEKVFHGFAILGASDISSENEKKILLEALATGMQNRPSVTPSCFYPRHGLAIRSRTDHSDYVICFECHKVKVYNPRATFLIADTPRNTFNAIATEHRLPIAGKMH